MRALIAAIATVATAGAGLSLSIPLLALRLETAGYSAQVNGAAIAIAGGATLVVAPLVPRLAAIAGMRSFILACLAVALLSLAGFAATADHLVFWWPLRAAYSAALTGLFVASEFAVNALAPARRRGVWIGIYSTGLAVGFAAGPLVLRLVGTSGVAPFVAGMALFAAASLPITLAGRRLPALSPETRASTFAALTGAPALMSAAFVFGAIETGAMGLLPVQALREGLSAQAGAGWVAALALGNVLFQIPLGLLSDRVSRPVLLLLLAFCATAGALSLAVLSGSSLFVPALVAWSGLASGLYMVGLAELGARHTGGALVAANAAYVLCYALGMVAGPPLLGRMLDAAPRGGLFVGLAALAAVTVAIQLASLVRQRAMPAPAAR